MIPRHELCPRCGSEGLEYCWRWIRGRARLIAICGNRGCSGERRDTPEVEPYVRWAGPKPKDVPETVEMF